MRRASGAATRCASPPARAEANVRDLMMRWFAVRETRVVESNDPVNYRYVDGRLESLTSAELITVE
jgi:hypothetical protein